MKARLLHLWSKLTSSYWFIPTIMLVASVFLALLMLWIDHAEVLKDGEFFFLYGGGTEGARMVLSTLAGSIITVAGVVFSITILTLTQASSQFGPRLLRNFMSDRGNQFVLGSFVATFIYCLLVLRSIGVDPFEVPQLSVTVGVLLGVLSLGVLIYFIHHVSFSLQAPKVVSNVWEEIHRSLRQNYPHQLGASGPAPRRDDSAGGLPAFDDTAAAAIGSPVSGYLQAMDELTLMELAEEKDLQLKLLCRPGSFVMSNSPLLLAWPASRVEEELIRQVQKVFIIGRYRTPEQDVEFGINQLVEIAVRALSPSTNDPFTATNCIDWLGEIIARIAATDIASPYRYDGDGNLRILANISSFEGIVDAAFNAIRQYGRESPMVVIRLLEAIAAIAPHLHSPYQRDVLRRHARMILGEGHTHQHEQRDRDDILQRYRHAMAVLDDRQQPLRPPAKPSSES